MKVLLKNETDSLQLSFNVALSSSNSIPIGNYSISEVIHEFSLNKGFSESGSHKGCWLLGPENFSIETGNVEVTSSNSTYTLKYNLQYKNTRITGSYSGNINFLSK